MSPRHPSGDGPASAHLRRRASWWSAGVLGVVGSAACTASMIAAAVGVGGATAATSMAGMTAADPGSGHPGGVLGAPVRIGPG